MTVKTQTTIKAADILAVEFECPACHAIISIRLQNFKEPPIRCSQCDARGQWLVPGREEFTRIAELGETLRMLARANGEHVLINFLLRPE